LILVVEDFTTNMSSIVYLGVPILEGRIGGLGVYPELSLRASIFL